MHLLGTFRFLLAAISFAFLLLGFPDDILAVTISIGSYPSTITDEPFSITASISGASTGTNYLRLDLYKDQTTSYFGETYNGSDWYGGSTFSQYLPVSMTSNVVWSGILQGRVGSPSLGDYDGTGVYRLRVRRYTSGGGNTALEANNSSVVISIALPTATPTPTNVPTPTSASAPTFTPSPTPTPTKTPTPTIKNSPAATSSAEPNDIDVEVLGTESSLLNPSLTPVLSKKTSPSKFNPAMIFVGGGIMLVSASGIIFFRKFRKEI